MSATVARNAAIPRGRAALGLLPLVAAGVVVLACGAAKFSGFANPPAPAPVIASVALTFADAPDGAVIVRDAATGHVLETVPARGGGFLRSTMRVMATERAADHIGPQKPFRLAALQGNRLQLTDTATGQTLELEAFGPSNAAEFANILTMAETTK
jgi:putative photosynthetic complex assembly protein